MQLIETKDGRTNPRDALLTKIDDRSAVVGVMGVGYLGLPVAVDKAKAGFQVIGYDRNAVRVEQLNRGLNYISGLSHDDLVATVASGNLSATTDHESLGSCDVILICLPTPLTSSGEPDPSHIAQAADRITLHLRPGQLVCMEGVTYPGATEEVLVPALARGGLTIGVDFFVAASPERVDPGNANFTVRTSTKVAGGVTAACTEVAAAFYRQTIARVVVVSSPRIAELSRTFEDTFRAVNIALVNELAVLCEHLGANVWEVLEAAATKPFGMMRFDPGPGVGGPCLPLDPNYLAWKGRLHGYEPRLIQAAGSVNASMPDYVTRKIERTLHDRGIALAGSRMFVIGVAYKRDIGEWRYSPAVEVLQRLERAGSCVEYHDPLVPSFKDDGETVRRSVPLTGQALANADCVVILTDHGQIDWQMVVDHARLVVDARNATRNVARGREKVILL